MRILLVEDDRQLGAALEQALTDNALTVDWVADGEMAISAVMATPYDVVLMDIGLPRKNGKEVLRHFRKTSFSVPVIILTARDALEDRIEGLDLGADDYLVKPFDVNELLARIRAVCRRHHGASTPLLGNGMIKLDTISREALLNNERVPLTAREYALLYALIKKPGSIKSRADLESQIYGWGDEVESNAVEFIIHHLRKKLGAATIKNIRGLGWMVPKDL